MGAMLAAPVRGDSPIFQEKPETQVLMGSLPIFKHWRQIPISKGERAGQVKASADSGCQRRVCFEAVTLRLGLKLSKDLPLLSCPSYAFSVLV